MTRILVVEVDRGERLILSSRLEELGYETVVCPSGPEAFSHAKRGGLDLVLLSAALPGELDGYEVCRRLKAIPELGAAPIVVYASDAGAKAACERAYDAGCEAFLAKAQIPHLGRVVEAMIRIKARTDEVNRQNRVLEQENRRLGEECRKSLSGQAAEGQDSQAFEAARSGCPDGVLVVDTHGRVKQADRGAYELLGTNIEGRTLGSLVPASGLEAFVRDARTDARDGFRFDLGPRGGRPSRSLIASVTPVTKCDSDESEGLRIVLLLDVGKRRVAEEMRHQPDSGIPRHQLVTLMEAARKAFCPESIVGTSAPINALRRRAREVSRAGGPVVILGERGTGAEFLARVVHYTGALAGSFLHLRCGALSPDSQENEIFGYANGDVSTGRPGLLLLATGGTVFLAGIEGLAPGLQEKLYEALRSGAVRRRGATRSAPIDVRLVASTSEDLAALAAEGRFHGGLFSLLTGNVLEVPPLREFLSDLPAITADHVRRFGCCKEIHAVDPTAMWVMQQYHWPGNMTELEDCMEHACGRSQGGSIAAEDLTLPLRQLYQELPGEDRVPAVRPALSAAGREPVSRLLAASPGHVREWDITDNDPINLELYERKALLRALAQTSGDKLAAARLLKVGKSTLYRKLKRLGIH